MIFVVLFEDHAGKADMRTRHMSDHLAFLETHAERIRTAGPLMDAESGAGAGGMWLVEARDAAEVRRLVETDPFWPTGLRKSVRTLEWRRVFADGGRLKSG